jgi:hypothetical protein
MSDAIEFLTTYLAAYADARTRRIDSQTADRIAKKRAETHQPLEAVSRRAMSPTTIPGSRKQHAAHQPGRCEICDIESDVCTDCCLCATCCEQTRDEY